ncbi:ParA family protein [Pseudomonas orientalis]|uniref:ParA family protein n=1 Tax=Pseudomonas orientalis TaxID=76758 RepID=UPI000CEC29C3|nr:ParA family protein [Pseudomonas orientalis]
MQKSNSNKKAKTILLTSVKGGVSKTTTSYNLATNLANKGYSVHILDLDIQRSCAKTFENRITTFDSETKETELKIELEETNPNYLSNFNIKRLNQKLEEIQHYKSLNLYVSSVNIESDVASYVRSIQSEYDFIICDSKCEVTQTTTIDIMNIADLVIFPYLDSALDLETVGEIDLLVKSNIIKNKYTNTIYRSILICDNTISKNEEAEFVQFFKSFYSESQPLLNHTIKKRKAYKEAIFAGKGVCEVKTTPSTVKAQNEFLAVAQEILNLLK